MRRLLVIIVTAAACFGAGATAGPVAFASEFGWPLSEINFRDSIRLGIGWSVVGALIGALVLALADRKHFFITALIAVVATWLTTCAGVWWIVVSSLG